MYYYYNNAGGGGVIIQQIEGVINKLTDRSTDHLLGNTFKTIITNWSV